MVRSQKQQGNVLALASLMCLMTGLVSAQDLDETGIIHITDIPSVAIQNGILPTKCDRTVNGAGACRKGCYNGCPSGNCQNGSCPPAGCQNGASCPGGAGCGSGCNNGPCLLTWLGFCQGGAAGCNGGGACGGKLSLSARRILNWVDPCSGTCTHSPMTGFTPPNKRPYFRQPVSYQHDFPANWVGGTPSGYHGHRPAVYTPTDTTQLGYYYQKVPTWTPVPGMIPPAPQPGQWHYYGPTATAYAPYETAPAGDASEVKPTETETAPVPPLPEEAVEVINLERTPVSPTLIPINRSFGSAF